MSSYEPDTTLLQQGPLARFVPDFLSALKRSEAQRRHGDLQRWMTALQALPMVDGLEHDLSSARVRVGHRQSLRDSVSRELRQTLQMFMPWRKGPFDICGIHIDTEWRSDLKWDRLMPHISPLEGRTVLDVGCGSGYHLWRMLGAGARFALGIEPSQLYCMQFNVLHHFIRAENITVMPLTLEQMPAALACFDTVFSMGVLYHRRDHTQHLRQLAAKLSPGGELVLETLIIPGEAGSELIPDGRYARMRNVWRLPDASRLLHWIRQAGFVDVRLVDQTLTTRREQRSTVWMPFESLDAALDPFNRQLTIEGYPAPRRAIVVAAKSP